MRPGLAQEPAVAASVVCAMTAPFAHLALRRGVSVYATKEHMMPQFALTHVAVLAFQVFHYFQPRPYALSRSCNAMHGQHLQAGARAASTSMRKGDVHMHDFLIDHIPLCSKHEGVTRGAMLLEVLEELLHIRLHVCRLCWAGDNDKKVAKVSVASKYIWQICTPA